MKLGSLLLMVVCVLYSGLSAQSNSYELVVQADQVYNEDPGQSYVLCSEAEKLLDKDSEDEEVASVAICLARYYILVTQYDDANTYLNQAIEIYTRNGNLIGLSSAFSLKSILMQKIGDAQASRSLLIRAVEIERQLGDTSGLATELNNLSLDYMEEGKLDSMKLYLDQLEELKEGFYPTDWYYYHQNRGLYNLRSGNPEAALQEFRHALPIAEQEKMTDSKASLLASLSETFLALDQVDSAEFYAYAAVTFSEENNLLFETSEGLQTLIEVKEKLAQTAEAYELYKKLVAINKQIYDLEKVQAVRELEGQLKLAEKESEIAQGKAALDAEKLETAKAQVRNLWMFGILAVVVIILVFTIYVYLKTRKLNAEIQLQKQEIELKSENLQEALSDINASLEYSRLIQATILPSEQSLNRCFADHFVFYKPRDLVSGDFYWLCETEEATMLAVADCTGHGVPGAMVSMVCSEALNKVVKEYGVTQPNLVLDQVREIVESTFGQNQSDLYDGMDIALCTISGNQVSYSGAHNPLLLLRDGELVEYRADKQPIGKYSEAKPFSLHSFEKRKGDQIYLFSDGYADQFGGEKGKKFKSTNFKKLIVRFSSASMNQQRAVLSETFETWKADLEQVDDVCVMGVKL